MKLRPYQERVINDARDALRKIRKRIGKDRGPRLLIQCPTGGGKTVLASFITRSHLENVPDGRVRFMCHRDFLVDQTSGTFTENGIDHSYIAAKRWQNDWTPVHVCMVQTVGNRLKKLTEPTLVIWDECHHIAARTWAKIMEAWPNATHVGLSATPVRLDGKGLDAFFDDMVLGPTVAELIELKALSDYAYFAPTAPDLTGMHTRMGDYVHSEIDEEMGKAVVIGNLVQHYAKHARGKRGVYFCTSIKNSRETVEAFAGQGFRFIHLDGDSSSWEREQAALALAKGDIDGMTNVDLFGEGFDLAACARRAGWNADVTIEVVGLARPTKSLGLSRQQIGRVLRPKSEPGIILDHAGHLTEFGLPDDDIEWSLKGVEKKAAEYMHCDECGAAIPKNSIVCKACGAKIERDHVKREGGGAREVEFRDGDLQEIEKDRHRKAKKLEEWQASSLDELIDIGKRRDYRFPEQWAAKMWTLKERRKKANEHAAKQQLNFYEGLVG